MIKIATTWSQNHAVLARFDCDLSLDLYDPEMKRAGEYYKPDFYYQHGLSESQKKRIQLENQKNK